MYDIGVHEIRHDRSRHVVIESPATSDTFDEDGYLLVNPDVRAAVAAGYFATGRTHFDLYGHRENRLIRRAGVKLDALRATKLDRLRPLLDRSMPHTVVDGRYDYLTAELSASSGIAPTDNESSNGYDRDMLDLIAKYADGLVLDCGAGRRPIYYDNVVNLEIVAYDTTDVLAVGEKLPFADASFDCIFSVAVLEHVRDPFQCAAEIARVLKPGGELLCTVPFLQPLHGYPHHYFNATKQGIRRLFEDRLRVDQVVVPEGGHPAYALHWILTSWARGLDENGRQAFRSLKVGEMMDLGPGPLKAHPAVALAPGQVDELASGFLLRATRRA